MKREQIKAEVEKHLSRMGVSNGAFVWQLLTAELLVIVGEGFRKVKLKSGISQRALLFEMGRISGWLEMAGRVDEVPAPKIEPSSKIKKNPHANTVAARRTRRSHPN